jgi:hypothetical protein
MSCGSGDLCAVKVCHKHNTGLLEVTKFKIWDYVLFFRPFFVLFVSFVVNRIRNANKKGALDVRTSRQ